MKFLSHSHCCITAIVVATLTSCIHDTKRNDNSWSNELVTLLQSEARYKMEYLSIQHDTLTVTWSKFPDLYIFQNSLDINTVKHNFHFPLKEQYDTLDDVPCIRLSAYQSRLYWSIYDSSIIKAELRETDVDIENILKTKSNKKYFFNNYFKSYPSELKNINTIEFYTGFAENSIYYTFHGDKLNNISMLNIGD